MHEVHSLPLTWSLRRLPGETGQRLTDWSLGRCGIQNIASGKGSSGFRISIKHCIYATPRSFTVLFAFWKAMTLRRTGFQPSCSLVASVASPDVTNHRTSLENRHSHKLFMGDYRILTVQNRFWKIGRAFWHGLRLWDLGDLLCQTALDAAGARALCTANPERSSLAPVVSVKLGGQGWLETEPRVWCIGYSGAAWYCMYGMYVI